MSYSAPPNTIAIVFPMFCQAILREPISLKRCFARSASLKNLMVFILRTSASQARTPYCRVLVSEGLKSNKAAPLLNASTLLPSCGAPPIRTAVTL